MGPFQGPAALIFRKRRRARLNAEIRFRSILLSCPKFAGRFLDNQPRFLIGIPCASGPMVIQKGRADHGDCSCLTPPDGSFFLAKAGTSLSGFRPWIPHPRVMGRRRRRPSSGPPVETPFLSRQSRRRKHFGAIVAGPKPFIILMALTPWDKRHGGRVHARRLTGRV